MNLTLANFEAFIAQQRKTADMLAQANVTIQMMSAVVARCCELAGVDALKVPGSHRLAELHRLASSGELTVSWSGDDIMPLINNKKLSAAAADLTKNQQHTEK